MAGQSIEFPASPSTPTTKQITLPTCGSWMGLVRVRISTFGADATLNEWLFIWPNGADNKTKYRRVATGAANNWYNSVLKKDQEQLRWLAQNESIMRLTYTSNNPISVTWETTRSIIPLPFPSIPTNSWNYAGTTPWATDATGNTGSGNTTEKGPSGFPGQLAGRTYWKTIT